MSLDSLKKSTILFLALLSACKPEPEPEPTGAYSNGVFVVNEGIYGQTSGTITYYQPDSQRSEHDIFKAVNGRDLGNVVQSLTVYNGKAYIVVNNSNKIEIADANSFEEIAQVTGLAQPRYLVALSDTLGYVSQWGSNGLSASVAVVDLRHQSILQQIPTRAGAEQMQIHQNHLFVACTGGYETDSVVQVMDIQTNSIIQTIITNDAPNSLQWGSDGNLWVLCGGKTIYSSYPTVDTVQSTAPALVAIRPGDGQVVQRILLQKGFPATRLCRASDGRLYFLYQSQIWQFDPQSLQRSPLASGDFYGLGCVDDQVYAMRNAGIQRAWVLRYSLSGAVVDSFQAGTFANGCGD